MSAALVLAGAAFALVRALSLRRALVDRPYRDRALWTAIGGLSAVLFVAAEYLDTIFGSVPTTWEGVVVEGIIWGAAFLVLFTWIVTNVNVSISADFFNRDALWWKMGGRVAVLMVILIAYVLASIPSSLSQNIAALFVTFVIGYSALVLALTYSRTRDMRIRTYTKWVVLTIVSVFFYVDIANAGPGWPSSLVIIPALGYFYCTYQGVSTLAIRTKVLPT